MTEGAPDLPIPSAMPVILVVEDSLPTLNMLCEALTLEGYDVLAARDVAEALDRLAITVPDGILLDGILPDGDGFSLCSQIKATPAWAHIPVLFMTGLSETEQILQGFASGGVDYVVKPLRLPEVMARLATHVRNAKVARLARDAVDVAGMGSVMLDSHGRVAWCSPQARDWLGDLTDADTLNWLKQALTHGEARGGQGPRARLLARHMGQSNPGESMLLLTPAADDNPAAERLRRASLTPRETEVLAWLAKGKTNRDIGDILVMSPRTVNKHLEHVFAKLGVETRSAAAAIVAGGGAPP
ncbi:DNA-binding response regulator [Ottowia thiooxydans]|uniref:DNA-binding response OmpR family regulator/DNA-binding CsgD family transcriptional regulator n=1 Tax=Ottowia thiooxydans TaxID=219182 RepID=A0ABV2QC24_9BURK